MCGRLAAWHLVFDAPGTGYKSHHYRCEEHKDYDTYLSPDGKEIRRESSKPEAIERITYY